MTNDRPTQTAAYVEQRWHPGRFFASVEGAPEERCGYLWRGLAMAHQGWARDRTKTIWTLFHIGSGGGVIRMVGNLVMVMPVAVEIADATDWTLFDLATGWRQTEPELPSKVRAICQAHPDVRPETRWSEDRLSDAAARAVIEAREMADARPPRAGWTLP